MIKLSSVLVIFYLMMMAVYGADPYQDAMQAGYKCRQSMKWDEGTKNYETALGLAKTAVQKSNALLFLGICQDRDKKNDEALKTFGTILALPDAPLPLKSQAQINIGLIFQAEKKYAESVAEFKKVLAMSKAPESDLSHAQMCLARSYRMMKSYDEAVAAYEKFFGMSITPAAESIARVELGKCQMAQKKYDAALESFEKSFAVDSSSLGVQNDARNRITDIATYYRDTKEKAKAIAVYEKLLQLDPDPDRKGNYLCTIGLCYFDDDKFDDAIKSVSKAINLEKVDPAIQVRAYTINGRALFGQKKYPLAIESFEKAIEIGKLTDSTQAADMQFTLGRCYVMMKNESKAKKELRKILEMDNATVEQKKTARDRIKEIENHGRKRH